MGDLPSAGHASLRRAAPTVVVAATLLLPSVAWIFADTAPFGGDQSQYGRAAVELYVAMIRGPHVWLHALLTNFPSKPNAHIWIGQFFVPLAHLIRSIDRALLLSLVVVQFMTILLIFGSVLEMEPRRYGAAVAAGLFVAAAPLFVTIGHYYLGETVQTLSTALFIYVVVHARRWNRGFVCAALVGASAFALAAKQSQPLFCVWPGLFLVYEVARSRNAATTAAQRAGTFALTLAAVAFSALTAEWYWRNFAIVRIQMIGALSTPAVHTFWGRSDTYANTVMYWIGTARDAFFLHGSWLLWIALVTAAVVFRLRRRTGSRGNPIALIAALEIATVLLVFSTTYTRLVRFLLPLIPFVAILLAWSLLQIGSRVVTGVTIALLTLQFASTHLQALGYTPLRSRLILRADRTGTHRRIVEGVVDVACSRSNDGRAIRSVLAIDPSYPQLQGDWLGPEPANFAAVKRGWWAGEKDQRCRFDYFGGTFFGEPLDKAWADLVFDPPDSVVTVDPARYEIPSETFNPALDRKNLPRMIALLTASPRFGVPSRLPADRGILVFESRR